MVLLSYIAHGHCYLWQQNLVWLHLLSDSAITIAYYSIPLTLIYLVRKREDLPFDGIFLLFAGFIVSCGTTHLMEVWTIWHPTYWVSGVLKAITGVISCTTAVVLLRLIPKILAIPSQSQLETANGLLLEEIQQRKEAESKVRQLNVSLESRVADRTRELETLQQESERQRQQLRAILDNTTSVVYVKDLEGRLILINEKFTALFDQTPEEMLGKTDFDYLPSEVAEQTRTNDQQVLAAGQPVEFEETVPDHDQLKTYISVKFPLCNAEGNPYALGGISTDITERKQNAVALAQRAQELSQLNHQLHVTQLELEAQNRELDQFTYIVSHDLKAPLRGISNLSEWITEDLEEVLTDETRHELDLLRDRVQRMERMIQGLLEYSRIGRVKPHRTTVNVKQLVAECIDSLDPPQSMRIEVGEMPILETEEILLRQILMNLIGNAIKHHHQAQGIIQILATEQEGDIEFAVIDNGPGISETDQKRIFNIFETLQPSDSNRNTGIGLTIVKKVIQQQGGTITVASDLGQGTTFRFTWPRHASIES